MQQATDRSLRELQRETEQTRAGLTQTVEQLKTSVTDTASEIRQRISPDRTSRRKSRTTFAPKESGCWKTLPRLRVETRCRPSPLAQASPIHCLDWQGRSRCRF